MSRSVSYKKFADANKYLKDFFDKNDLQKSELQEGLELSYEDDLEHFVARGMSFSDLTFFNQKTLIFARWMCGSPDEQFEAMEGTSSKNPITLSLAVVVGLAIHCDTENISNIKETSSAFENLHTNLLEKLTEYYQPKIENDFENAYQNIKVGGTANE